MGIILLHRDVTVEDWSDTKAAQYGINATTQFSITIPTFTCEDLDFIDENEDEYVDRVLTVIMKKNISFAGFGVKGGLFWAMQTYHKQFTKESYPECEESRCKYQREN